MLKSTSKCNGLEVVKRRKIESEESEMLKSPLQIKTRRCLTQENSGDSTCESVNNSDLVQSSPCCSSNGSSELVKENPKSKSVDLELQGENEVTVDELLSATSSADWADSKFRRESIPQNDVLLPSTQEPNSTMDELNSKKMPSEAELEEFFNVAEKSIQKKFVERYNYDIVKDQPLEGRYEWVQLKP